MTFVKPGGIVSAVGHTFQAPPPPRDLPSARLLRHAFLLAEADNVQDYRRQILSTFVTVLKMDSTKKVCKSKCNHRLWRTEHISYYKHIVMHC